VGQDPIEAHDARRHTIPSLRLISLTSGARSVTLQSFKVRCGSWSTPQARRYLRVVPISRSWPTLSSSGSP